MPARKSDSEVFTVEMAEPFTSNWERIPGISVDGPRVTIDPDRYFFRRSEAPVWMLVDWDLVVERLLSAEETEEATVEQKTLEFVRAFGQRTQDPAAVLRTADRVYRHLFSGDRLDDPDLSGVSAQDVRILRESATFAALNRVAMTGEITDIGPAWFFPATARVVYDLDADGAERVDDLYHGGFFNEYRRVEAVKAHAALGGRLVHGCQSSANMSGGAVVPFGVDLDRFRAELSTFKQTWTSSILNLVTARPVSV
ncbi:hypothetical protein [Frankia sp. Cr1]|uniref:hypothetical protein n=1 Tax=Frankia sp. Cr1 TaxID=3073931 RepID=UPI002AD1F621|nr:hypothetical protein [Frankia sp. Cr1]